MSAQTRFFSTTMLMKAGPFVVIGLLIGSVFFAKLEPQVESIAEPVLATRDLYYGLAVVGDKTIWLAGSHGKIARSDDGGKSWVSQPSDAVDALQAIVAFDAKDAVAVGDLGLMLYTHDGGTTWAHSTLIDGPIKVEGEPHKLLKARIDPAGRVWAVGELGTLLVSEDRGQSFKIVMPFQDIGFNDIAFADAKTGWLVGEFGDVFRTTDGGATWTGPENPIDRSFMATYACGGQTAIAVGLQGLVMVSQDAGASWTAVPPKTDEHLFDVTCTDKDWLASGDKGIFVAGSLETLTDAHTLHLGDANNFWHTALTRQGQVVYASGANAGLWTGSGWTSFVN